MTILCSLGFHRAAAIPRWNDGFYFSTCSRCGRDLVRTAFERWHVPRGFRIVWSETAPSDRPTVGMMPMGGNATPAETEAPPTSGAGAEAPEPGAAERSEGSPVRLPSQDEEQAASEDAEPDATEVETEAEITPQPPVDPVAPRQVDAPESAGSLPIQVLLDQLEAHDSAGSETSTEPQPEPEPEPMPEVGSAAPARRPSWDFMDDEPGEITESGLAEEDIPTATRPAAPDVPRTDPPRRRRRPSLRLQASRLRERLEIAPKPWASLAIAAVVGTAVVLAYHWASVSPPPSNAIEAPSDVTPWASPGNPTGGEADRPVRQVLYVTASVLSCRSAPAQEGQRVRNLARGDAVELIARAAPWASLAYRGRQCWALEHYLSPVKPY